MFLNKKFSKNKGQGTIEYLVIIAIVVIVALIVVGLLISLMDSNGDISGTSNQINYKTQPLALNDYLISTDGNYLLEIKSNEIEQITVNNISINGEETPYTTNNTINLGQERLIKIQSNTTCEEGQKITTQNITITYTTTNGLTKKQIYENITISCQNYTNPNESQLLGGTTSENPEEDTIVAELREGLVGYWALDETEGTTAYDNSGSEKDGTITGVTINQEGKVGRSILFNTGEVSIPSFNLAAGDFSMSLWYKGTLTVSAIRFQIGVSHWQAYYEDGGTDPSFYFTDSTGSYTVSFGTKATINDGDWHLLTVTFDESETSGAKTYLDGYPINSHNTGTKVSDTATMHIGSYDSSSQYTKGNLDEVAIWNRVLTSEEIESLYNEGNGLSLILTE